jgi:hypothetical protein
MWENMIEHETYVLCMLNSYGYRHTLRICNSYCFCTAKMVMWTRLVSTLYSNNLNPHKHNWLIGTPRWCYLNLLHYTYIACLVRLLLFCNHTWKHYTYISPVTVCCVSQLKDISVYLSLDSADCAAISEGHCYIDDVCSVYFSVRKYILLSYSAVRGRNVAVIKYCFNSLTIK